MAKRLRTRLNRLESRHAHHGRDEPSVQEVVRESAALYRWLAVAGYDSPLAALARACEHGASSGTSPLNRWSKPWTRHGSGDGNGKTASTYRRAPMLTPHTVWDG